MKKGRCIHYNGLQNECCKAGVRYKDLTQNLQVAPCLEYEVRPGYEKAACDKRELPTAEQVAENERIVKEMYERHLRVHPLVLAMKKNHKETGTKRWKHAVEIFACPGCDVGSLTVVIHRNGHTQGKCSTKWCVAWIE